jgi:DNA-3-methyladenine glycosylase II
MSLYIEPRPPFDFDLQWRFFSWDKPSPEVYENGVWRRALRVDGELLPVRVESIGVVEKPKLNVDVLFGADEHQIEKISEKLRWIFNSEMDLTRLYGFMDKDRKLREVKQRLYGLKPANYASVFEGVVKTIIQQQISLIGSMYITSRLILRFGGSVRVGDEWFYEFPSPSVLAEAPLAELRECGLSRQKSLYIKGLSGMVEEGLNLEDIKRLPPEQAIEELMKLKGVGRWTAELVVVTSTECKEVLPADDLGVRRAVSTFFSRELMSGDDVRKVSEGWGEFKALVAYYLICDERELTRRR